MKLRLIFFIPSNLPHIEQTNSYVLNYLKKLESYNINIQIDYKSLNLHLLYTGKGCVHVEETRVLLQI